MTKIGRIEKIVAYAHTEDGKLCKFLFDNVIDAKITICGDRSIYGDKSMHEDRSIHGEFEAGMYTLNIENEDTYTLTAPKPELETESIFGENYTMNTISW